MKLRELISHLDSIFPFQLALEWDNSGLQVGDPEQEIQRILITLDITEDTIEEAKEKGCQLILSHHPLIFRGIKSIDASDPAGGLIFKCIKYGISVVSMHTNVDAAPNGLARKVAEMLEIEVEEPLTPEGIGVVGRTAPLRFEDLLERVKGRLKTTPRIVEGKHPFIEKVALCPGSGGDLIDEAMRKGVHCYITGDIKYHQAQKAHGNMWIIDAGHFATEYPFCELIKERLRELDCVISDRQRDFLKPISGGAYG